jgi:hypothetical protein
MRALVRVKQRVTATPHGNASNVFLQLNVFMFFLDMKYGPWYRPVRLLVIWFDSSWSKEFAVAAVCRSNLLVLLSAFLFSIIIPYSVAAMDGPASWITGDTGDTGEGNRGPSRSLGKSEPLLARVAPTLASVNDFLVKVAYGRTFGTSTELDYATLELSKSVSQYPVSTSYGPGLGEIQIALLASYVFYYGGTIERVKRLDFRDGYELAWLPKGRFSLSKGPLGVVPYFESGAGISYVSETYRNSGSRFNWSLLGGLGLERRMAGLMILSFGIQWRHLSNGNMWGKGDELHNSNSGTDMVQGLATLVHRF